MALTGLLVDAALLALIVIALGFTLAGLALCLDPGRFSDSEGSPGGWLLEPLESPYSVERFLYRHHRWFGALVVISTGFVLWRIASTGLLWSSRAPGLEMTMLWLLVVACGFAFLAGVIIFLRPSTLKPVEARANRWVGWRGSRSQQWLRRHPRVRGGLIVLVGVYSLVVFGLLLVERMDRWPVFFQ